MRTGRRDFLKTVSTASAALVPQAAAQNRAKKAAASAEPPFPRTHSGPRLRMIAFPLGGIGAGSISLGGRGQLRDWEIFNHANKGRSPSYAFPSIWAQRGDGKPVARILESEILPPYEGASGLGSANVPGLPRFDSARFTGEFPMARIEFGSRAVPVKVALEAFTPFAPLDADDSGLPVAVLRYQVSNPAAVPARVAIAWSIDNPVGATGRSNEFRSSDRLQGLLMRNPFLGASDPMAGSFAVSALAGSDAKVTYLRGWRGGTRWRVGPLLFWDDFSSDGELGPEAAVRDTVGSLSVQRTIPAGKSADFTFLLSWHFPNRTCQGSGWSAPKGDETTVIGNYYSTRFADAWAAAEYTASHLPDLENRTRQFVTSVRRSTLPAAVKEAAMANLSTLVSTTSFRTSDGVFHGFEGVNDSSGCCFGNCTHVWNYETATAWLFPSLSKSLRESAFGFSTDERGFQGFRKLLPDGKERYATAAADGQMGQIIHLYLDWRLSGDTAWLRSHWPAAKRALEFAWIPGGWDANRDGVMEGVQHNTYDVEFLGPNPLCGVWYLGALRAAEEMARAVGDDSSAADYARLFRQGSAWIDANLFNGEYYVQKIQGMPKDQVAQGLISGMGSADTENPDFQVGDGCLVDQLAGQTLAEIAGLGPLLGKHVEQALRSILKYNYKRSMHDHQSVQRVYALNDEAALVICDYGKGKRPLIPFPYFAEVMTGFEYTAAVLMLHRGMVDEGVEVIGNIRARYDGERRNPWNEAECGHHYARAMASWAAIPALAGFSFHAAVKRLEIRPRINAEKFRSFWSTGTAWGEFSQTAGEGRQRLVVSLLQGQATLRTVRVDWAGAAPKTSASAARKTLPHKVQAEAGGLLFDLGSDVTLHAGEDLVLTAAGA